MSTDKGFEAGRPAEDVETVASLSQAPAPEDEGQVVIDDDVLPDTIAGEPALPRAEPMADRSDPPVREPDSVTVNDFAAVDPEAADVLAPEPAIVDPKIARLAERILSVAERMKAEPAEIVPDEAMRGAVGLRSSDALDLATLGLTALLAPRAALALQHSGGETRAQPQPAAAPKPVLTVREVLENAAPRALPAIEREDVAVDKPAPQPAEAVPLDVLKAWVEQAEADDRVAADHTLPSAADHFPVVQRSAYSVAQHTRDLNIGVSTWDVMLKGISGFAAGLATSALAGFLLLHFMSGN